MVQTGKPRTKRPDGRSQGKAQKKKEVKMRLAAAEAKDLKITKLSSRERKERVVSYDGKSDKTNNIKLLRALRKKLRAIDNLKDKLEKGVQLDPQQLEKLELEEETRENLKNLEKIEEGL